MVELLRDLNHTPPVATAVGGPCEVCPPPTLYRWAGCRQIGTCLRKKVQITVLHFRLMSHFYVSHSYVGFVCPTPAYGILVQHLVFEKIKSCEFNKMLKIPKKTLLNWQIDWGACFMQAPRSCPETPVRSALERRWVCLLLTGFG